MYSPCAEPADHGIGRSRGGLTSKIHALVEGHGRPLCVIVTGGQVGDSLVLPGLLDDLRVPRHGGGRPRTRPESLAADKAYSSRGHRGLLRRRGIKAVIPEPADQQANRKRRGSAGGRPVSLDTDAYKGRNVVERAFNHFKQWRGLATRYDKHAMIYRGAAVLRSILIWLNAD